MGGRIADGCTTTSPDQDMVKQFRSAGGEGKPLQGGLKVYHAATEDEAADIAHRLWANSGLPGELAQVLPSPKHFKQASSLVTKDMTRESVTCGSDAQDHLKAFEPYVDAGFDEIYVANMGLHYAEMLRMYGEQVLPELRHG